MIVSSAGTNASESAELEVQARWVDSESAQLLEARAYAEDHGISPSEALEKLALQMEAAALDAALGEMDKVAYAGLWIEHEPTFRIRVAFAAGASSDVEAKAAEVVAKSRLSGVVEIGSADYPLAKLEADHTAIERLAWDLGLNTYIDIATNRIVVTAPDLATLRALAQEKLPSSVVVDPQVRVGRPAADGYAGLSLSNGCTAGWILRNTSASPDIYNTSTAGHCSNSFTMNGATISCPATQDLTNGYYDTQLCSTGALTLLPWVRTFDSTVVTVRGRRVYDDQTVGSFVCKYGKTTGRTCGYIAQKTFRPSWITNATATYVRVEPRGGPDMVNGGDSGGPVFATNATAYGIVSGEYGAPWCVCDLIYTAIPWAEFHRGSGQPRVWYVPN